MNILWIVNIVFPEANKLMGGNDVFTSSGGWLIASAEGICTQNNVNLYVLTASKKVTKLSVYKGRNITYCIIPICNNHAAYGPFMHQVKELVNPDIIHIHGTELPFGKAWIDACSTDNVVVSIQGLVSVISRYYLAGLTTKEIVRNITFRDLLRKTLWGQKKEFEKRGRAEIDILKKTHNVIGRTSFDRAHCVAINPLVRYYHCDEILRSEFYEGEWSYSNCTEHSIFLSQASYSIKGLHMVLRALPIVKRSYPNVKLRIAGRDITQSDFFHLSGYGSIIKSLIKNNKLNYNVEFLGPLDASQMKKAYLDANVFICPSSIENSSNSLGEAQVLGVPCLASYVGGLPDMMHNAEGNLYRYEEIEMLASLIEQLFAQKDEAKNYLIRDNALRRHDKSTVVSELLRIYEELAK